MNNLTQKTFTVVSADKWTTSQTTGTGGVYHGFGISTPISITTETFTHDRLFLLDSNQNLHDLELTNWNIGCEKDHTLRIVWEEGKDPDEKPKPLFGVWITVKEINKMGATLAIKNLNTRKVIYNEALLKTLSRNPFYIAIPVAALLVYLLVGWLTKSSGTGAILFSLLIGVLIWMKTNNPMKYRTLKEDIDKLLNS